MKTCVFAVLTVAFCASLAWAHSPSAISIAIVDGKVEVVVSHPVSDPIAHYIKLVTVSVNGKEAERREFTAQDSDGLTAAFEIPDLKPRDKISVSAVCSRFGEKRGELIVE